MAVTKKLSVEDLAKLKAMHSGISLDLQLTTPTGTKRVRTEFIGRDNGRLLLVKFPDEAKWGGLRDVIFPDGEIIVRYILEEHSGEIVAFKSKVVFILTKPIHIIFLNFPSSIQLHGLRSTKRTLASIPAKLTDGLGGKQLYEGVIVDISQTGCRFTLKKEQVGGKKIELADVVVSITTRSETDYKLSSKVVNYKSDELNHYFGIKFEESEENIKALLDDLLLAF
ncbi:flagellar brake protein [Alteromonadaceae bacterium BrNp21-10]|nr:flagellar brake protein [Alteromonadaceae bacterium BrNp21-10]